MRSSAARVVAIGELSQVGDGFELTCRRAFLGSNIWARRSIRIGGGGAATLGTLAIGDLTFLGDEIFLNPCRPVLIGREVFVTQRSMIVTRNVGHSLLEGFENRFAAVVLEDRSPGRARRSRLRRVRIGRDSIIGSNSYVISDIPPGKLALEVPAKVAGPAHLSLPRATGRARVAHGRRPARAAGAEGACGRAARGLGAPRFRAAR